MKKRSFLWILTGCALSACAQTVASVGFTSAPLNTRTEGKPVAVTSAKTPAPTRTPTATATSTVTPTSGPPPDLELFDVTTSPDSFNQFDQMFSIMGRIRNNTNQTMVFTSKFVAFNFKVEIWEFDQLDERGPSIYDYLHLIIPSLPINPTRRGSWNMNCFLFPGEEGVVYFDLSSMDAHKSNGIAENVKQYDGPLGLFYSYTSYYETDPSIPRVYRIPAENISFRKVENSIEFQFDVDLHEKHLFYPGIGGYDHSAWVILCDKDGKIINIFHKSLNSYPGYDDKSIIHIASSTSLVSTNVYYFSHAIDMTPEMVDKVDHIEVMTEMEEAPVCLTGYKKGK